MSTLSVQNITGILNLNQVGTINAAVLQANSKNVYFYELISPPTSVGTGTTFTYTNIPPGYHELRIEIGGLSHLDTNPAYIVFDTSNNNGSTWQTNNDRMSLTLTPITSNLACSIKVTNASGLVGKSQLNEGTWGGYYSRWGAVRNDIAPINALRFSMNAGNFQSGTTALYGLKFSAS